MPNTLIINPVNPIGHGLTHVFDFKTFTNIMLSSMLCVLVFLIVKLIIKKTPQQEMEEKDTSLCYLVSAVVFVLLFIVFGWSVQLVKGAVFFFILLYASLCDIQTRRVKDVVSVMIFISGFISLSLLEIFTHTIGAFLVGGIMFVCALFSKNRLGGADVKITAASVFVLGMWNGIAGLVIGLIISVIVTPIINRKKKLKEMSLPLVPYLSIGFMAMYLIQGGI